MLSFFRRNPVPNDSSDTFSHRVREFWAWFREVGPSYLAIIDAGNCDSLTDSTTEKVHRLFPGFGWTYGPGKGGIGHSLTLTGEGVEANQLLALHWLSQAPEIEGWTFYAARQAGPIKGHIIEIAGQRIDPKEIWVTPSIDTDEEQIDLTVWHPLWPRLESKLQWQIVFLFLDEMLGEYGTGLRIGEIRLENDRLAGSFPLEELHEFVEETSEKEGWKAYQPGETYSMLKIQPSEKVFPRHDLLTLSTVAPKLFQQHREAKGKLADPLEKSGADFLYVSFSRDLLPPGQEVNTRYELEEALDTALKNHASGRCIGGGLGTGRAYVDLLVYDGKRSLDIVVEILKVRNFPRGTTIEYLAKEKAGNRIML